jgi:hypothetical protein
VFVFIMFFFNCACVLGLSPFTKKACGTGWPAGVVFRGHRVRPPVESRLVEGERLRTRGKKTLENKNEAGRWVIASHYRGAAGLAGFMPG